MDLLELKKTALRMAHATEGYRERPIVGRIFPRMKQEPRIKLLRGLRGVGKTTIMLQLFLKSGDSSIYLSADSPAVKEQSLYELLKQLILSGSLTLFVDEIHTYPYWRKEIKAIYDEFPGVVLVCSGSAPLALVPERREKEYEIPPLNLSEYIYLKSGESIVSASEWKSGESSLKFLSRQEKTIEAAYHDYLQAGAFPISFSYGLEDSFEAIYNTIRKSIRDDSVSILKLSAEKVFAMEKFLILLATSPPGELSITSLSSSLDVSKTTMYEILNAMEEMKLIRILRPYGRGHKLARGEPKVLFCHPNLRAGICRRLGADLDKGAVREESVLFGLDVLGWKAHTIKGMKSSPDYFISRGTEKLVIEIGGKSKGTSQLKEFASRYKTLVLRDDQIKCLLLSRKTDQF